jgi:hypothetical protein
MRDIRNDLKQRARLLEDEIAAAYAEFEQMLERLKGERDGRLANLQGELAALGKLLECENRRMGSDPQATETRRTTNEQTLALPQPTQAPQQAQATLADFVLHKLNEMGPLSKDDLVNLTLQEGIYADPDSADHGVHATLVSIIQADHIRQLHDGTFVPNTLPQALRARRA